MSRQSLFMSPVVLSHFASQASAVLIVLATAVSQANANVLFSENFDSNPNINMGDNWNSNITDGAVPTPGTWSAAGGFAAATNVGVVQSNAQYSFSATDFANFGSLYDPGTDTIGGGSVSGSLYLRFDIQFLNPSSHSPALGNFGGLQLHRGTVGAGTRGTLDNYPSTTALQIGSQWGQGVYGTTIHGGPVQQLNPVMPLDANWHTIVARVDYNAGAADGATVYFDPNYNLTEAQQSAALTTLLPSGSGDFSFDTFVLRAGNTDIGINFDNVIFGAAATDTGFMPDLLLTLEVNTTTGGMWLKNESGQDLDINYYSIDSDLRGLNRAGFTGIANDPDFPAGDGSGNGWEIGGDPNDPTPLALVESYLAGDSTFTDGKSVFLGNAFNTAINDQNLRLVFNEIGTNTDFLGSVVYVTGVAGDYNGDGMVDAADYTVWRDTMGDIASYNVWKSNFGQSGGSGAVEAAVVPEPGSALLALWAAGVSLVGYALRRRSALALLSGTAWLSIVCLSSSTLAAVTNDRQYLFGDPGSADAILAPPAVTTAANVSEGSPMGFVFGGQTSIGDEATPYRDLRVVGATYTSTAARPLAGSGDFGARFDGSSVLFGDPVNIPEAIPSYPLNYTDIHTRGMQFWTRPDASAVGAGRQTIVMDTVAAGGVAITADGKWTQINSGHIDDFLPAATVEVVGNQWHHVMHHIYATFEPKSPKIVAGTGTILDFTSVVYANGIAVSVNNDTLTPAQATAGPRAGTLSVGAEELPGDGITPNFGNHFTGVVDNLEVYVYGDNTTSGGQNWGAFNLFTDNEWIANQIATTVPGGVLLAGDVTRDGNVDDSDVNALIANWRRENRFIGAHNEITSGDWATWGWGDIDLNGTVDFADWYILRANHANGANLDLAALLAGAAVPEPSTIALLGAAAAVLLVRRCTAARNNSPQA